MSLYSLNVRSVLCGEGSAVAASAYMTGCDLHSDEDGETKSYGDEARRERVKAEGLVLCHGAPPRWAPQVPGKDDPGRDGNDREARRTARERMWNDVESCELALRKRGPGRNHSSFARRIIVALQRENTLEEQVAQVRELCGWLSDQGVCCDWAVHWDDDEDPQNPHAHILCTARELDVDGVARTGEPAWSTVKKRNTYLVRRREADGSYDQRWIPTGLWRQSKREGWEKCFNYVTGSHVDTGTGELVQDCVALTQSQAAARGMGNADRRTASPVTSSVAAPGGFWQKDGVIRDLRKAWEGVCNRGLEAAAEREGAVADTVSCGRYGDGGGQVATEHLGPQGERIKEGLEKGGSAPDDGPAWDMELERRAELNLAVERDRDERARLRRLLEEKRSLEREAERGAAAAEQALAAAAAIEAAIEAGEPDASDDAAGRGGPSEGARAPREGRGHQDGRAIGDDGVKAPDSTARPPVVDGASVEALMDEVRAAAAASWDEADRLRLEAARGRYRSEADGCVDLIERESRVALDDDDREEMAGAYVRSRCGSLGGGDLEGRVRAVKDAGASYIGQHAHPSERRGNDAVAEAVRRIVADIEGAAHRAAELAHSAVDAARGWAERLAKALGAGNDAVEAAERAYEAEAAMGHAGDVEAVEASQDAAARAMADAMWPRGLEAPYPSCLARLDGAVADLRADIAATGDPEPERDGPGLLWSLRHPGEGGLDIGHGLVRYEDGSVGLAEPLWPGDETEPAASPEPKEPRPARTEVPDEWELQ